MAKILELQHSPSSEYSGLIFFQIDWFDLFAQESFPAPQFESINSSVLSFLYGPTVPSITDHWKDHSFNHTDLGKVISLLYNMLSSFVEARNRLKIMGE